MKTQDLPEDTRATVDALVAALTRALDSAGDDIHLKAMSQSSMPYGAGSGVIIGGDVSFPDPPPFELDATDEIQRLHEAVLESGNGLLYGIILLASRDAVDAAWTITAKAISRAEYAALCDKREPIDQRVAEILEEYAGDEELEFIAYGQARVNEAPILRKSPEGAALVTLDPDSRLTDLFEEASALYRGAGLEPLLLDWSLQDGDLDVEDYFQ